MCVISGAGTVVVLLALTMAIIIGLTVLGCVLISDGDPGTWCQHAFCWDCLADHKEILEKDNSAHKGDCPWHPDNIKD